MEDLKIVQATIDDLNTILELQKKCYITEAELYNDYNIPPLTQTIDEIKTDFTNGTLFLKGMVNEELVASVRGISQNETTYIGRLAVKEEFQNRKIGQILMKEIENRLNKCKRYELFTGHKSEKNIRLYQKLGYSEYKTLLVHENLTLVYLEKWNTQ
jgi:ribosomal protein S18 acetylase RimI-like enzyme